MLSNQALEQAMEHRRVQLRLSWRDVSRAANMSYEGLRAIRRGDRHPSAITKAKLEDALRWSPGSIDAIFAGGEPSDCPETTPQANDEVDAFMERFRRLSPHERARVLARMAVAQAEYDLSGE